MAEKNTFGQVKIGAYSARTEELLRTLLKLADRWEVIADDVEGDCYAGGAPYPVTGKCITEEHTFCLHQDKGADITTYGLGFKPLRGICPDVWLSTIHNLCTTLSWGPGRYISRLARSEKDGALLLQTRLREDEAARLADRNSRALADQNKAAKDLAVKLRMLCIILYSLCEPETKKIEITTTTVKKRYELTEEYKKAVFPDGQSKYPTYFHPETYAEADLCCTTTALSTSSATLSTTKEELLAFADFLDLLPAPKKSAVKQFKEQHGEAAYEKFMGAADYDDPFKLASYALVEKAAREADEALLA